MGGKVPRVLLFCALLILPAFDCRTPANVVTSPKPLPNAKPAPIEWERIADGLAWQQRQVDHDGHTYNLTLLRADDSAYSWGLHYAATPKRLSDWQEQLSADIAINGSFFTEDFTPTGFFKAAGQVYGQQAYTGKTIGTIAISDGKIHLVPDSAAPTDTSPNILQSFPLLLRPGGEAHVASESDKIARRTIIGHDQGQHTFVIVYDTTPVSLFDAAAMLADLPLELDWALNLDGGPSTGLIAAGDKEHIAILPAIELPIVLSASANSKRKH